jgi:hypothetical protein
MDPDPVPDPNPFFIDFKDAKKMFPIFFHITCPQANHLQSIKFNYLLKICVKILFCRNYFSPLNTFMRKESGAGSGSGAGSVPLTNGSGSGRPKKHADPDPDPQNWPQIS